MPHRHTVLTSGFLLRAYEFGITYCIWISLSVIHICWSTILLTNLIIPNVHAWDKFSLNSSLTFCSLILEIMETFPLFHGVREVVIYINCNIHFIHLTSRPSRSTVWRVNYIQITICARAVISHSIYLLLWNAILLSTVHSTVMLAFYLSYLTYHLLL